ncbi:MAG TPA: ribonuclease III, partial [Clostridia bacterium]|nr:ribonuclease III [Clostridia bacterium]
MTLDLTALETGLGFSFRNQQRLLEALTHPSHAYEHGRHEEDNQRLEFLGDAVLQLLASEYFFEARPDAPEGEMTKLRADVVCEQTLTRVARNLRLGSYLRLGHGEALTGGDSNPSNLSDALEAVLGAIYLEGGLDGVRQVVVRLFEPYFKLSLAGNLTYDHKSRLYEWAQARDGTAISFRIEEQTGPDHDRRYRVGLYVDGILKTVGSGKTKKAAEQDASFLFFDQCV